MVTKVPLRLSEAGNTAVPRRRGARLVTLPNTASPPVILRVHPPPSTPHAEVESLRRNYCR